MNHKWCRVNLKWQLIKLTVDEAHVINTQAEETHDIQMKHCLERARQLLGHVAFSEDVIRVGLGLFDKEATPTAFIREEAIDRKAEKLGEKTI